MRNKPTNEYEQSTGIYFTLVTHTSYVRHMSAAAGLWSVIPEHAKPIHASMVFGVAMGGCKRKHGHQNKERKHGRKNNKKAWASKREKEAWEPSVAQRRPWPRCVTFQLFRNASDFQRSLRATGSGKGQNNLIPIISRLQLYKQHCWL